ncbi:hypothetical protein [Phascolarctobacterium sp.]
MINAEIEARELQDKLARICPEAKIDLKFPAANEAVITIHNPNGGLPVNIFSNDFDHEFKVVYFKTPRFFPANQDGIAALLKAIADYVTGKVVYMDIISTSNNTYPHDRLVPVSELPGVDFDFDELAQLCINKNLLSESELRFELQAGSSVCINFWDQRKNFCYKMQNGKIIKK